MTNLVFHHNPDELPDYSDSVHPVLLYNVRRDSDQKHSVIGGPILQKLRELGIKVPNIAFDFLTIALSVTAAETFINRNKASNAWARQLSLEIPLYNPDDWTPVAKRLEKTLGFLTGDEWSLNFTSGGLPAPAPKKSKNAKAKALELRKVNCVSLFSGGLDSAIGAFDLINDYSTDSFPLLVSHSYKSDAKKQGCIENLLTQKKFSRLALNASARIVSPLKGKSDISMRGRSFNFIAMAIVGLATVQMVNKKAKTIYIPENGYIALNPPLTRRRIGSLSTRTTHPYYLTELESILKDVGFNAELVNPYQYKTKGEMIKDCADKSAITRAIPMSVSCSNWHRKNIQCGRCVPCIIRRASIFKSGIADLSPYESKDLQKVLKDNKARDDILALSMAILKMRSGEDMQSWVRQSGTLPTDKVIRENLAEVFKNGLQEVEQFLVSEKVI